MEDHHHSLHCPLLHHHPSTTTTKPISSDFTIFLRLFLVTAVGIISVWANHEASKGFEIHIENLAGGDSPAGRRFHLFYVSNDKATRLVLSTSKYVETILYHHHPTNTSQVYPPKKRVNHVTLRLSRRNMTTPVSVESAGEGEFIVILSPSVMEQTNVDLAMSRAVQKGMTLVWLYRNNAPKSVLNGIAEYVSNSAGFGDDVSGFPGGGVSPESFHGCWNDGSAMAVASFFSYCEQKRKGFIQRLNQAMRGGWDDRTVDDALGMSASRLCKSFVMSREHLITESWR